MIKHSTMYGIAERGVLIYKGSKKRCNSRVKAIKAQSDTPEIYQVWITSKPVGAVIDKRAK